METLTSAKKQQNLEIFKNRLQGIGVNTEKLMELYGEKLLNATYSFSNKETEFCGDGSLLNTILRILTPTALKINELLPGDKMVDNNSIIKVCFLHQISKAIMVSPNENKWEIENKGMLYKFNPTSTALKGATKSIAMCIQCEIGLTEQELESIVNLDREGDKQIKYYSSALSVILRQANELTDVIGKIN